MRVLAVSPPCCPPCLLLLGESVAVQKCAHALDDPDCELQAKENMLFSGTAIANGTVTGIVVCTGMATEIGKIQSQIQVDP